MFLTNIFWPGPLTLILKANDKISPKITADTGYVGIRHP
jgi:tRNA A37 threonylcarbamoyladenosine synthetase subunit TsaC/SUA5/YrdC